MARFINLAPAGDAVLVNFDEITLIETAKNNSVSLWAGKQNTFYQAGVGRIPEILDRLKDAGLEMLAFPAHAPDTAKAEKAAASFPSYVRPDSITYVTTAQDAKGLRLIRLGIDGRKPLLGTVKSMADEKALMATIQRLNPALVRIAPSQAATQLQVPAASLLNPAKISRIEPVGNSVHVHFGPGDFLYFIPPQIRKIELPLTKAKELLTTDPELRKDALIDPKAAQEEARHRADKNYERQSAAAGKATKAFARALAAKAPQLNSFAKADPARYCRLGDIASICIHKTQKTLTVFFKNGGLERATDLMDVSFRKKTDLKAALQTITIDSNKGANPG